MLSPMTLALVVIHCKLKNSHNNTYTEAQNKYDRAMNEQLRKIADA